MIKTAQRIRIPTYASVLLQDLLGLLDPNEKVEITFVALGEDKPDGAYVLYFDKPQVFDSEVLVNAETIEFIE